MYGIQVHFKGNTSIKQILMKPKDTDPKDSRSGLIYSYKCPQLDCNDEYIGNWQDTGGKKKRTPETTITYTQAFPDHGTPHRGPKLQHHRKRGPGAGKNYKGINLYKGK